MSTLQAHGLESMYLSTLQLHNLIFFFFYFKCATLKKKSELQMHNFKLKLFTLQCATLNPQSCLHCKWVNLNKKTNKALLVIKELFSCKYVTRL